MVADSWGLEEKIACVVDYFRTRPWASYFYWPTQEVDCPAIRAHFEREGHRVQINRYCPLILEIRRHG